MLTICPICKQGFINKYDVESIKSDNMCLLCEKLNYEEYLNCKEEDLRPMTEGEKEIALGLKDYISL